MRLAALGLFSVFLVGFSPVNPAQHPNPNTTTRGNIYIHDPYVTNLYGNTTGKTPPTDCGPTQAIGLYDDGGSVGLNCLTVGTGSGGGGDGGITMPTVPVAPVAPDAGFATFYYFAYDAGFPAIPMTIDGVLGRTVPVGIGAIFQNYSTFSNWNTGCARVVKQSTGTIDTYMHVTPSTAGTTAALSWATTSFLTRTLRVQYQTSAAINSNAGPSANTAQPWRGDSAGAGGFVWWTRLAFDTGLTDQRFWSGLFNSAAVLSSSANPSAALNSVYYGCDSGNTNLSICSNDGSGTATCTSLGSSFPCTTVGAHYDLYLAAAPNASSISYNIERLDSAASAFGTISSDLPTSTLQLSWQNIINSGPTTASQARLWWSATCIASNQ